MVIRTAWSMARTFLLWAIPVALVAALVWTLFPHGRTAPPASSHGSPRTAVAPPGSGDSAPLRESAQPSADAPPYAEIRQGDLAGTDDAGRQRWRIVADNVTVVESKQTVLLRNVRATFYEKDGGTITVVGSRGHFDTGTRTVEIDGNVHGTSSNGREVFADRVRWVPNSERLTGIGHIKLVQEHVIMYADRMSSDTTLGQTEFSGHVHAAVR
jgi:LPS export ABC transporter protein LptC